VHGIGPGSFGTGQQQLHPSEAVSNGTSWRAQRLLGILGDILRSHRRPLGVFPAFGGRCAQSPSDGVNSSSGLCVVTVVVTADEGTVSLGDDALSDIHPGGNLVHGLYTDDCMLTSGLGTSVPMVVVVVVVVGGDPKKRLVCGRPKRESTAVGHACSRSFRSRKFSEIISSSSPLSFAFLGRRLHRLLLVHVL